MRHLIRRRPRGLTLIELLIALAIAGVLVAAASPFFGDFQRNSRLRESGNTVFTEALMAQGEAIKRNTVVRLSTNGTVVQVIDLTDLAAPLVLRERRLAEGVSSETATVDFSSNGQALGVGGSIDLSYNGFTCSTELRCPGLRVDGGGAVRLCGDHTNCS